VVIQIFFNASAEVGQMFSNFVRGDFGINNKRDKFDFIIRKGLAFARGYRLTF
jgi:hypothetical protein